jgi:hypothetical protein
MESALLGLVLDSSVPIAAERHATLHGDVRTFTWGIALNQVGFLSIGPKPRNYRDLSITVRRIPLILVE